VLFKEEEPSCSECYGDDLWKSSLNTSSSQSELNGTAISTSKDGNDDHSNSGQGDMEPTPSKNGIMSELLLPPETRLSPIIKIEEQSFTKFHDTNAQINSEAKLLSSSTLENGVDLSSKDKSDDRSSPNRQESDDRNDLSREVFLKDSPVRVFRVGINPPLGWQRASLNSIMDDMAFVSTSENKATSLAKAEAATTTTEKQPPDIDRESRQYYTEKSAEYIALRDKGKIENMCNRLPLHLIFICRRDTSHKGGKDTTRDSANGYNLSASPRGTTCGHC
jgi:hypothetical protein